MKPAIGAPDPGDFERNQPHNLFNDRRIGGKSKNRAFVKHITKTQTFKSAGGPPPPPNNPKPKRYPKSSKHPYIGHGD